MYKFLNFGKFQEYLSMTRILNLTGSMGSGKTLLGVAMGYEFLRRGFVQRAAFNFPCSFGSAPAPRWSYNVYDEAGVVFDNRMAFKNRDLNEMSAGLTFGLRKAGSYFVVPSFLEVDKRFRTGMRMWRTLAIRNLFWFYVWEVGPEDMEEQKPGRNYWSSWFMFFNPAHFFNTYDTFFVPGRNLSIAFLKDLLREWEHDVPEDLRGVIPGV